jgi:hypothetical protein
MITMRTFVAAGALGVICSGPALHSLDRSRYRDFRLGDDVASVCALAGVAASEVKTIHLRPALMQEVQWQRPYSGTGTALAQLDPVKQIMFGFYNDQLSRVVVDYDRDRTAGMTDDDLIDAISAQYGPRLKPGVKTRRAVTSQAEQESGTLVARWGDAEYSVVLYRSSYESGFRLVVDSPRLEALARTADAQATRLDEREAPAREIARQKKEAEGVRASQAKARLANKAAFRP